MLYIEHGDSLKGFRVIVNKHHLSVWEGNCYENIVLRCHINITIFLECAASYFCVVYSVDQNSILVEVNVNLLSVMHKCSFFGSS